MREYKVSACGYCKQEKTIAAKGYCRACYGRLQKTGSLEYKRKGKRAVCKIDGCVDHVMSNGLCDKHRQRLKRHGHTSQTRPNDWGKRESHPLYNSWTNLRRFRGVQLCSAWHNDFWCFVNEVPDKPAERSLLRPIDGDAVINKDNCIWIKPLSVKDDFQKEFLKNWVKMDREVNPDKYKNKYLLKSYGITLDDFNVMKESQGGVCKICGNPEVALNPKTKKPRELAVDHCHNTGKIRGLLCSKCNTSLGNFKDDISLLEAAIVYLSKNKTT